MSGIHFSAAEASAWLEWIASRPPAVADAATQYPPWHTYRLKTTGQKCRIQAYDEDEATGECTLRIFAWQDWMGPIFGRGVFGISPDDLELPLAGE